MSEFSSDRIKELLSDPKNIELIAGLASGMGGMGSLAGLGAERTALPNAPSHSTAFPAAQPEPEEERPAPPPKEPAAEPEAAALPAMGTVGGIPALGGLLAGSGIKGGQDKRVALLKAIKPYVNDQKKERVEGLVRAINVASLLSNYKTGLFG